MRRSKPNLTMDEIDVVQAPRPLGGVAARDELARDLGYQSMRQMMEQTELVPLPSGAYMHLTTDSDGYWVVWSDQPFCDIKRFDSRQSALLELRESATPIGTES